MLRGPVSEKIVEEEPSSTLISFPEAHQRLLANLSTQEESEEAKGDSPCSQLAYLSQVNELFESRLPTKPKPPSASPKPVKEKQTQAEMPSKEEVVSILSKLKSPYTLEGVEKLSRVELRTLLRFKQIRKGISNKNSMAHKVLYLLERGEFRDCMSDAVEEVESVDKGGNRVFFSESVSLLPLPPLHRSLPFLEEVEEVLWSSYCNFLN